MSRWSLMVLPICLCAVLVLPDTALAKNDRATADALFKSGKSEHKAGNYDAALNLLEDAIKADGTYTECRAYTADVMYEYAQKLLEEATQYERRAAASPSRGKEFTKLAKEKDKDARKWIDKAMDHYKRVKKDQNVPQDKAMCAYKMGNCQLLLDNPGKAEKYYKEALSFNPHGDLLKKIEDALRSL